MKIQKENRHWFSIAEEVHFSLRDEDLLEDSIEESKDRSIKVQRFVFVRSTWREIHRRSFHFESNEKETTITMSKDELTKVSTMMKIVQRVEKDI